jgi:hypothetical protein
MTALQPLRGLHVTQGMALHVWAAMRAQPCCCEPTQSLYVKARQGSRSNNPGHVKQQHPCAILASCIMLHGHTPPCLPLD